MSSVSKFVELNNDHPRVTVIFEGAEYELPVGQNLAAALLSAGVTVLRTTPVLKSSRSPYCMMGACYDCLVEIEGTTQQACMTEVRQGMIVSRVNYLDRADDE